MRVCSLVVLAVLASQLALSQATLADESPLKPGPGQDMAGAACSGCHTSDYIIMNSMFLTADGWKAEVKKMRSNFGAPIDDDTAKQIEDYLAAHYAVAKAP